MSIRAVRHIEVFQALGGDRPNVRATAFRDLAERTHRAGGYILGADLHQRDRGIHCEQIDFLGWGLLRDLEKHGHGRRCSWAELRQHLDYLVFQLKIVDLPQLPHPWWREL
jgi:hypothetical protein